MSREIYRQKIAIYRRDGEDEGKGGYAGDAYERIAETSCCVRDETESEYAAAESARIEHVRTFIMRSRDVRSDDVILWRGGKYRVRRVDGVLNGGREIRVRAALSTSRYTLRG